MPLVPRNILREYFMRGDKPTEGQFGSLLDSTANLIDDRYLLGLRTYDSTRSYLVGDTMIYNNALYQCIADTTGVFNPVKWQVIVSLGAVVYSGTWNAATNSPTLADGTGIKGYYYVVTVPGTRNLGSGPIDFEITDWVIYNGATWDKVDNSQAPVAAADVSFVPNGSIGSSNVQDAIDEVRDDAATALFLKADKVISATANDIALLDASGNLIDSGKQITDFLPSTTVAADIPFTPNGDIGATNVQAAVVEVRDDTDTKLSAKLNLAGGTMTGDLILFSTGTPPTAASAASKAYIDTKDALKADKVISATANDIALLDASGNLVDSGKQLTDYLSKTNLIAYVPTLDYHPATKIYVDSHHDISKADKVSGAVSGHFAGLDGTGNLTDSTFSSSSFLASSTVAVNIPFTPNGDIGATNVQAAIVEVRDDTDTKLLTKLNLSGGTMTGAIVLAGNPSAALEAAPKQYVDRMVPLAGGTMTGSLILNANPSNVLGAATKQYVDAADALKLNLTGGTLTGDLILFSTGTPPTAASAASKTYVDTKFASVPGQVKSISIPFTFAGAVQPFTSGSWSRFPTAATQIRVTVPPAGTIFPGTTVINVRIVADYMTTDTTTTGNVGLFDFTTFPAVAPFSGSTTALAATNTDWVILSGPSFTLSAARTFEIIVQRTAGTGTVYIEGLTLVITYQ